VLILGALLGALRAADLYPNNPFGASVEGAQKWSFCAAQPQKSRRQQAAPIRRSEIVRAKDNVSDYSGA
jgi:hypothetical protein